MNQLPIDPNCKHPDAALRYNPVWGNPSRPVMWCQDCRTDVTAVQDMADFIVQRETKYKYETGNLTIGVADPFGKPIMVGSFVVYPKPKSLMGWGIVEAVNHVKGITLGEIIRRPRVNAPDRLKIRPTDRGDIYGHDIRKDGQRRSVGLIKNAPWAVVVG